MSAKKKIICGILGILIVEILSYKLFQNIDLESYFGFWALMIVLLLIASIFGFFGNSYSQRDVGGIVGQNSKGKYTYTSDLIKPPKKINIQSGLFKLSHLVYLIMLVVNIYGYMFVKIVGI